MKRLIAVFLSAALLIASLSSVFSFSGSAYSLNIGDGSDTFHFPQLIQNGDFEIGTGYMADINPAVTPEEGIPNTTDIVKGNNDFLTSRMPGYVNKVTNPSAVINPSSWERTSGGAMYGYYSWANAYVNGYSGIAYEPVYNSGTSTYDRNTTNHVAKIGQEISQRVPAYIGKTYQVKFRMMMKERWAGQSFGIQLYDLVGSSTPKAYNLKNYSVYKMTSATTGTCLSYSTSATTTTSITITADDADLVNKWVDYVINFTVADTTGVLGEPVLQIRGFGFNSSCGADGTATTNNVFLYVDDVAMYDITDMPLTTVPYSSGNIASKVVLRVCDDTDGSQFIRATCFAGNSGSAKALVFYKAPVNLQDQKNYTFQATIRQTAGTTFGRNIDTYKNPSMVIYEPGAITSTGTASAYHSEGQNDYSYSYHGSGATFHTMLRRTLTSFDCFYTKGGKTFNYAQIGSTAGRDTWTRYNATTEGKASPVTADTMYSDWVTQGYSFKSEGQAEQFLGTHTSAVTNKPEYCKINASSGNATVNIALLLPWDKDSIDIKGFNLKTSIIAGSEKMSDQVSAGGYVSIVEHGTHDTLTATPYKGFVFDGWYVGSTLLSNENPYDFAATEEIDAPVAKFIADGAIYPEGSYENIPAGTELVDYAGDATGAGARANNYLCSFRSFNNYVVGKWGVWGNGSTSGESGSWSTAKVSTDKAHSGTKSIKCNTPSQTVLSRKTLKANTWYEISLWYHQTAKSVAVTSSSDHSYFEMLGAWKYDTATSADHNNSLGVIRLNRTESDQTYDTWRQYKARFFTGNNTDILMGYKYGDPSPQTAESVYIDDFSVTEISSVNHVGIAVRAAQVSAGVQQGLRFKTRINLNAATRNINTHEFKIVEYGTLAIKSEYLGSNELILNGSYDFGGSQKPAHKGVAYDVATSKNIIFDLDEGAGTLTYTGVLIGFSTANLNKSFTVRPYMIVEDAVGVRSTIYGNVQSASVFEIAQQAYHAVADGAFLESNVTRQYLFDSVLHVVDPVNYATFLDTPPAG